MVIDYEINFFLFIPCYSQPYIFCKSAATRGYNYNIVRALKDMKEDGRYTKYTETRSTRPRITRKLKPSFMVPVWAMIICWSYFELLVIIRTDKLLLVPPNYLFCGWMCFVTSLISLFSFHMRRKFSQEMEYTRAKWTHYGDHVAKAKGEHNS